MRKVSLIRLAARRSKRYAKIVKRVGLGYQTSLALHHAINKSFYYFEMRYLGLKQN